jgi:starch phosphorylase
MKEAIQNANAAAQEAPRERTRTVCHLSAEFLPGPHPGIKLINLDILDNMGKTLTEPGLELEELLDQEQEPGAGHRWPGQTGRLLPGLSGHTADTGHRLRHSLRARHL